MKRLALVLLLAIASTLVCRAQSSPTNQVGVVDQARPSVMSDVPPLLARPTNDYPQLIRRTMDYDGAIPQARRSRNPLQLINPFAPANYGSGLNNVVVDPRTGRAEGISIFTARF